MFALREFLIPTESNPSMLTSANEKIAKAKAISVSVNPAFLSRWFLPRLDCKILGDECMAFEGTSVG
jgi:hypothetical protein